MQLKQVIKKKIAGMNQIVQRLRRANLDYFNRKRYIRYLEECPVEEKVILLEALDGGIPTGNIAAILKELYFNPLYKDYRIYLSGKNNVYDARKIYIRQQKMDRVTVLATSSKEYYRVLATAKYLCSEVAFFHMFIKRPEQIYLNTWHGTPLKTLGRSINNDFAALGNVQKNMFDADFLLCPNEFTMNVFIKDYMLENYAKTKLLLTGYPRNCVFLDAKRREEVRKECGFGSKQIIAFMPTWRGTTGKVDGNTQNQQLHQYFQELDAKLTENQIFYVKLHQMNLSGINLSGFNHIKPFPSEYDSYEFLNATDLLITDYSSVFFDYANCRQKIILFTYDKEAYMADRGFYFPLEELPFPQVGTVNELLEEIKRPKEYDDTEFLRKFCSYDHIDVTKALCEKWIRNKDSSLIETREVPDNGKKNVVLYAGDFANNEITTELIKLLHKLDTEKYNYSVIFRMNEIAKHLGNVKAIPDDVNYMGFYHARSMTLSEAVPFVMWKMMRIIPYRWVAKTVDRICEREKIRIFSYCRIDKIIQYTGYTDEMIVTCSLMPCSKTIYVHKDKQQEIKLRGTTDKALLSRALKRYDSVAVVAEDLIPSTQKLAEAYKEKKSKKANFVVCNNIISYEQIEKLSRKEILLGSKTVMNTCKERILDVLESDRKKFVSMGEFVPEKGHFRLISAFEKLHENHPDTCLFLVGNGGSLYGETVERVKASPCRESIFVIRNMSNPYPLLRACDYFVLSSFFDGSGIGLVTADILGVPCFSTDIAGPRLFMQKYGGKLVADSEEGILQGMTDCLNSDVPKKLNVDYEQYNREAIAQFESLIG